MKLFELLWFQSGFTFIVLLVLGGLAMIALHGLFEKITGKSVPRLAQAVLLWLAAYVTFRYLLLPPIPWMLFATYMGIASIGIVMLILSTTPSYEEVRYSIVATLRGETPPYRVVQAFAFVLIPLAGFLGSRYVVTPPPIPEPIELRSYHPAPPARIEVHGRVYDLVTATNPFREERIPL